MPASDRFTPHDPLRYLVHGTKDADKRNTQQENEHNCTGWITPDLTGTGFAAPDPPKGPPRYRLHFNTNSLEIDGHVDVTSASSGDLLFVLGRAFWRDRDIGYATHLDTDGDFTRADVTIDSTNGEVRVYW